jgi:uncharacterized protein YqjF (DUF2071 family)
VNANADDPRGWKPLFRADWTRFVFLHYAVPPEELAPYTPLHLDCRDGSAFVSLVFFRFERMRPARFLWKRLGREILRPASDSWFLNVRTYVNGPAGPGIQFLVEWMDNPLSLLLGPLLYGLPYRRGRFEAPTMDGDGASRLGVTDAKAGGSLRVVFGGGGARGRPPDHSLESFLLEKYTAYTHFKGVSRFFRIDHPRWEVSRPEVKGIEDTMVVKHCPWFAQARHLGAHASPGFRDIAMGCPQRVEERHRGFATDCLPQREIPVR